MDVEERLQLLSEQGAYEELCTLARGYLAGSAEQQNPDTAYMARVLLGQTLLGLSAERGDVALYTEGARLLMQAYNDRGSAGIYDLLYAASCAPNEAAMRANYERNRHALASLADAPALPDYDDLPVLLFPLTNDYSVLFDRVQQLFLLNVQEHGVQLLFHTLIFSDVARDELALCMERFSHAVQDDTIRVLSGRLTEAMQRKRSMPKRRHTQSNIIICTHTGNCMKSFARRRRLRTEMLRMRFATESWRMKSGR